MIESEQYLLCCYRYIELNPVRAGMVKRPEEWKWSSYASNGYGEENPLIKPHPLYLAIHKDKEKQITGVKITGITGVRYEWHLLNR